MATAAIVTRSDRAAGIVERHECIPLDDGTFQVRDTRTGSGQWHIATVDACDCYDSRKGTCKHQIAVRRETAALEAYAARWAALARPSCKQCGAALESRQYWTGGRGYQWVEVCANDVAHSSRRA